MPDVQDSSKSFVVSQGFQIFSIWLITVAILSGEISIIVQIVFKLLWLKRFVYCKGPKILPMKGAWAQESKLLLKEKLNAELKFDVPFLIIEGGFLSRSAVIPYTASEWWKM